MPFGYDLKQLYKTAIRGTEFTDMLRVLQVRQLLVLLDCCHAGGVVGGLLFCSGVTM